MTSVASCVLSDRSRVFLRSIWLRFAICSSVMPRVALFRITPVCSPSVPLRRHISIALPTWSSTSGVFRRLTIIPLASAPTVCFPCRRRPICRGSLRPLRTFSTVLPMRCPSHLRIVPIPIECWMQLCVTGSSRSFCPSGSASAVRIRMAVPARWRLPWALRSRRRFRPLFLSRESPKSVETLVSWMWLMVLSRGSRGSVLRRERRCL